MVDTVSTQCGRPPFPVRDVVMIPGLLPIFHHECEIKSGSGLWMRLSYHLKYCSPSVGQVGPGISVLFLSGFESLQKAFQKAKPVVEKEGVTPWFYIRSLVELEDFVKDVSVFHSFV